LGCIAFSVYTAAASGSDINFKSPEFPMPAFSAALSVASFAASDHTAGTVKTNCTFVIPINVSPYLRVNVSMVWFLISRR
jgi:hypothetical protein